VNIAPTPREASHNQNMADVTLSTPGFDGAPERSHRAASRTLRTWGFEVERRAKMKSPVDTGFNKNTIYTVAEDGTMYANQQRISQRPTMPETRYSTRLNRNVKRGSPLAAIEDGTQFTSMLGSGASVGMIGGPGMQGAPIAGLPAPAQIVVEVRVGSEYGIYLEMGTVKMEARPFLGPAGEEVTPMIDGLLARNLKREGLA
jgi:hypothetical protein